MNQIEKTLIHFEKEINSGTFSLRTVLAYHEKEVLKKTK